MMTMINVHRTGRIEFSDKWEGDAICLGKATRAELKRAKVWARLAYDGVTLLVPGIPEAETEQEALEALWRWRGRVFERHAPSTQSPDGRAA